MTATATLASPILDALQRHYPKADCALDFTTPLQLLIATILSAQCTDERVNRVTPALFARFPDAASLGAADIGELEELVRSTGFYRNKAKAIKGACSQIVRDHQGEVPQEMAALTALPGVARKTANVVLGTAYGIPSGVVVDTHVKRLAKRLGLTTSDKPVKIEQDLVAAFPQDRWIKAAHQLIIHGRQICFARKPDCGACPLAELCPASEVGNE